MLYRIVLCFTTILCIIFIVGCADPLTKTITDAGYYPLYPAVENIYIGNTYQDLKAKKPICLMNMYSDSELFKRVEHVMEMSKIPAEIKNYSEDRTFDLHANVAILNEIKGELRIKGINKYSLKYSGLERFQVDLNTMATLIPGIKSVCNKVSINDRFVLFDLLKVGALEYTFYTENEAKVSLATADGNKPGNLNEAIKGELGSEWKITKTGELKASKPIFIGYRPLLVKADEIVFKSMKSGRTDTTSFVPLSNY